jgi:hypothetical protein
MKFLSKERQGILIRHLVNIGMPRDLATIHASYPDDLRRLDRNLSHIVTCVLLHSRAIQKAARLGNENLRIQHEEPLRSNMMILTAYRAELIARGLPLSMLTRTGSTVGVVLKEVRTIRDQLGTLIAYEGTMQ